MSAINEMIHEKTIRNIYENDYKLVPFEEYDDLSDEGLDDEDFEENLKTMDKNTSLHFAASAGLIDQIEEELNSSTKNINAENFMGWTPLMMAIRNGHIEAVKLLMEKGADITKKNKFGVNCFNLSIANGNIDLVEAVLQHMLKGGISRNRIQDNISPLSLAIVLRKTDLMTYLINQGFDVNAVTAKTDLTPLMFAAAVDAEGIATMLESKGANKNAENYMGIDSDSIVEWRVGGLDTLIKNRFKIKNISIQKDKVQPSVSTSTAKDFTEVSIPLPPQVTGHKKEEKIAITRDVFATKTMNIKKSINENTQNDIKQTEEGFVQQTAPQTYASAPITWDGERPLIQSEFNVESPIIHHAYQYESPYNGLPFPMYIPANCVSPAFMHHNQLTPVMVPSPFHNFLASAGGVAQNSPYSQTQYTYGQPCAQVFFPGPFGTPDMAYATTAAAVPNAFYPHSS